MTPEQRAVLIADLEYRARYLRQPEVASFRIGDLAEDIALELDRAAIAIMRGVAPAAPTDAQIEAALGEAFRDGVPVNLTRETVRRMLAAAIGAQGAVLKDPIANAKDHICSLCGARGFHLCKVAAEANAQDAHGVPDTKEADRG